MASKPNPAPTYRSIVTFCDTAEDAPGPRCGHTLTAVAATGTYGPRLILFGGATALGPGNGGAGIRLAGATNAIHSYDVLTTKWTRLRPAGEAPSPRAAHAAAAVGTMVVFQGGIGSADRPTDDLYVLDLTNDKLEWRRVVVQGKGPGPRYGHVMELVAQRYLVTFGGKDGERVLSDAWALDTAQKPYVWQRLNPGGDRPSGRVYATASAHSNGMFLLCGGRDASGTPLADAYGLMHTNGQWEWTPAPGIAASPRCQHASVFVGTRLHVTGGVLRDGHAVEGEAAIAVLDTAAGVWLDRNGVVMSSHNNEGQTEHDPSLELMRRCRHAVASVGVQIYTYGGLRGDILLDDLLVAENSPLISDLNSPVSHVHLHSRAIVENSTGFLLIGRAELDGMASKLRLYPAPTYHSLETLWDTYEDAPGPRCGHTLTAIAATKTHGPRLILFGGTTTIEGLDGVTNAIHSYDVLTRKWTRLRPAGEPPSPRAAHAAAAVRTTMVVFQGGKGSAGHPTDDLYVLDLDKDKLEWRRVVVPGQGPGPRYGHVVELVAKRYLVTFGGNDGKRVLSDAWALDIDQEPYVWQRLNPKGDRPSGRMYATASAYSDGMILLCGGRDDSGMPLADAYGLMHTNGQWEWTLAQGIAASPRCQHASVFVGTRLHVTGGVLRDGRAVEGEAAIAVLETAAGVWLDRNGVVTSSRNNKGQTEHDPSLELIRRSRHAVASVDVHIYTYGGLRGDILLDDLLVAENSPLQSDLNSPVLTSERTSEGSLGEVDVRLHSKAVVIAKEADGNLGGMVRQLSLDQFENERRRMVLSQNDLSNPTKKFTRQKSPQGLHKKIISTLLKPQDWKAPVNRKFFLDSYEVDGLCSAAEHIFMHEPTVLQLKAPVKVFGDLHGQFGDLMRLFAEYGFPSIAGDITTTDYLFLGDYVDRGQHSLETITLLLALKIEYPKNVHLIRGNHEAADINAQYGFQIECVERMGENDGILAWKRFNQLFNCLPLAALIEKKIICMHGGIGRSINSVEQIEKIERPIKVDAGSLELMDLLWSDPTENDSVEGVRPNARRGHGIVTFGPDRVTDFRKKNKLQLIIRAHECVRDGFERFAQGQLITLFSATNYCGTSKNAGAILVVGRRLDIVPKLIHPIPPPLLSTERVTEDTWMQELNIQRPPTPTRGRPG